MKAALLLLLLLCTGCTATMPIAATSNMAGAKEGRATATRVFGIWVAGDASIRTAAKNGEITRIATVDMQTTNVLQIYVRRTCIVTGYFDNITPPVAR